MTTPEIPAVLMEGAEPHTLMRVPIRMASAVSAVLTGEAVAVPVTLTAAMERAVRWMDYDANLDPTWPQYWETLLAASPWAPKEGGA